MAREFSRSQRVAQEMQKKLRLSCSVKLKIPALAWQLFQVSSYQETWLMVKFS